jgi:prevent-host-death family protein
LHVLCLIGDATGISATDVFPLSQARANFSELAEEVMAGAEKIVTKNGESYIALIDAPRLDYYHKLERERIHLLLIDEVSKGLDDVGAGRVKDARGAILAIKRRRKA